MLELKSVSYEEQRTEHFRELMKKMQRKIDWWQAAGRSLNRSYNSRWHNECSEAGMQYSFYKDALEALENQPKWISVEERYPADDQCVMYVDDGEVAFRIVRGWALRELCEFPEHREVHRITHWMPLPCPPEEIK